MAISITIFYTLFFLLSKKYNWPWKKYIVGKPFTLTLIVFMVVIDDFLCRVNRGYLYIITYNAIEVIVISVVVLFPEECVNYFKKLLKIKK